MNLKMLQHIVRYSDKFLSISSATSIFNFLDTVERLTALFSLWESGIR